MSLGAAIYIFVGRELEGGRKEKGKKGREGGRKRQKKCGKFFERKEGRNEGKSMDHRNIPKKNNKIPRTVKQVTLNNLERTIKVSIT
jgi:hypothetical protein